MNQPNNTPKQMDNQSNLIRQVQKPFENIYERPSTAPSKNDLKTANTNTMNNNIINNSNSLKRLPSPNIKCNGNI